MIRYAIIYTADSDAVARYLPDNYSVIYCGKEPDRDLPSVVTVIGGTDHYGWTLGQFVLPRLASGLYFGQEIDLSHPIMKQIPAEHRSNCLDEGFFCSPGEDNKCTHCGEDWTA